MIDGFDYSRYLKQKKIFGISKIKNFKIIKKEKNFPFYLFKFKAFLLSRLEKIYSNEEVGFLKAILLGKTNSLDENIKENFKDASISHVLAISGMHVSYIVFGLEALLKITIRNIKLRNIIVIIFLVLFTILVGGSNSICRACIMVSIAYIGNVVLRKDDFYASFKTALAILLILNPYNIFSGSMWLSFGGSIGIVLYSKLIEKIILKKINIDKRNRDSSINKLSIILNKTLKRLVATISVTTGAQIILFPIMIYIFNNISLNFIISNLLISELVGPILILGYLSFIFSFLSVFEKSLVKIILFFAEISANLPFTNIQIVTPKLYKIIIYYIVLTFIAFIYNTKKIYVFRKLKKQKLKIIFTSLSILIVLFGNMQLSLRKDFQIHFLDVGQGDSCLIRTTSNKIILIDGGKGINDEYDYGEKVVGPYLLDHGITKIDYVIVSHFDSDHCGGLFYVLKNFKVKNIIIGKQAESYINLMDFLDIQKQKKINLIVVEAGNLLNLDKDSYIKVLFPDINNEVLKNKINNNSLVFKLYYNNLSMLFTGDIEEEAENVLVNLYKEELKSDILKVGHHGSKTSSTENFINYVEPKIALIGVGKNNNFGHPNEKVIKRLMAYGTKVYRTDLMGEIILKISDKGLFKTKTIIKDKSN